MNENRIVPPRRHRLGWLILFLIFALIIFGVCWQQAKADEGEETVTIMSSFINLYGDPTHWWMENLDMIACWHFEDGTKLTVGFRLSIILNQWIPFHAYIPEYYKGEPEQEYPELDLEYRNDKINM